jgi:hypothetical protein
MSQQPPPPPPPQGYYQPAYQPPPPSSGKATTSLILGILSLIACGLLLGIPAMVVARQAKREIRESGGRIGGDGLATAGFVTGLIGTIWSVLAGLLVVVVFVFGASWFDEHCTTISDGNGGSTVNCDH